MKKGRLLAAALSLVFLVQAVPAAAVPAAGAVSDIADTQTDGQTGHAVPLSEETIHYDSSYSPCVQIPVESLGGIYFLNDGELMWYDLDTGETSLVRTFSGYRDCFATDTRLYFLFSDMEIMVYDLISKSVETTIYFPDTASHIGADAQGRIYLIDSSSRGSKIYLLSPSGEVLSQTTSENSISGFRGFDSSNGNFYVENYQSAEDSGFQYLLRTVKAGTVTGNTIFFSDDIVIPIGPAYWNERQGQVCMIGDRYLCVDNTSPSQLTVWDSHLYDPSDPESTEVFTMERDNEEGGSFDPLAAAGVRAVYREESGTLIAYKNRNFIAEYDMETGEEIISHRTDYPVFALLEYGDSVLAIEKSGGQFYYELIRWAEASEIKIVGETSEIKAGETTLLSLETDGTLEEPLSWSSSDPKVASVNQKGEVFGWKEGTAVITVHMESSGLSAQYALTVTPGHFQEPPDGYTIVTDGEASSNRSANNYTVWSSTVKSYLVPNEDGTFTRIEFHDGKITVEIFSSSGICTKTYDIPVELDMFGGFFSGSEDYYLVFGSVNPDENDSTEVLRVVKYSRDFRRIDALSIYGANTYAPFNYGSLRMTEAHGRLYIHTCHLMYALDGVRHQANMTLAVNQDDMSLEDIQFPQSGNVSHSFNQFIQTDGNFLYRVDHGDYYPRGISLTRCAVDNPEEDYSYTVPVSLDSVPGANDTGASVGGFELSSENCMIAGNAVDFTRENVSCDAQRNIFISITGQNLRESSVVWLTDYDGTEDVIVYTPQLVKIGSCQFLVMWEENCGGTVCTKIAAIDDEGNLTSGPYLTDLPLSDCAPVLCRDGLVRWYTTQNGSPRIYAVNPLDLSSIAIPALPFTDVDMVSGNWYYREVANVYEKQLMTGLTPTTFAPYDFLARAQFALILHRIEGSEPVGYTPRFYDVPPDTWYTDAILWAADAGIVTGYSNGNFGPSDRINREQMAVMMFRYAGMKGYPTDARADLQSYLDASFVDEFAEEAMEWAVGCGIITGKYDSTILDPHGNTSRAECAVILTRFMNYYHL